jgi:hypothetical protein
MVKVIKDTKHIYKGFEVIGTSYNSVGGWVLGGRHYVEGGVKRNYNIKKKGVFVINPSMIFSKLKYAKEYIDEYLINKD